MQKLLFYPIVFLADSPANIGNIQLVLKPISGNQRSDVRLRGNLVRGIHVESFVQRNHRFRYNPVDRLFFSKRLRAIVQLRQILGGHKRYLTMEFDLVLAVRTCFM